MSFMNWPGSTLTLKTPLQPIWLPTRVSSKTFTGRRLWGNARLIEGGRPRRSRSCPTPTMRRWRHVIMPPTRMTAQPFRTLWIMPNTSWGHSTLMGDFLLTKATTRKHAASCDRGSKAPRRACRRHGLEPIIDRKRRPTPRGSDSSDSPQTAWDQADHGRTCLCQDRPETAAESEI